MKVENVNNFVYQNQNKSAFAQKGNLGYALNSDSTDAVTGKDPFRYSKIKSFPDRVLFKGNNGDFGKRCWMIFRNVSDYMKEPSEMASANIQAIGTAGVAPVAILSSPNRNVHTKEEEDAAKEKKRFQAFRQPFSALIALGFQVPATILIARTFDHYAYEKPIKFFADETIENLIPDKKYLAKQAKKAMKDNADPRLLEEWKTELEYARNTAKVKEDLIKSIKDKYKEFGIELSQEKLDKMASEKKRVTKFVAEKMAAAKHDKLLEAKVEELKNRHFEINDLDLVTEEDKDLARHRFKDEFKALKKEKLSWFDNCIKTMGFGTGKIKRYNEAEGALAKQRGLELLKADKPEILNDYAAKFKQFIKNRDEHATKIYKNKKFWIQLATNLVMVAISCTVLNWMHPKFMDFLDGIKQAKKEEQQRRQNKQNAEVRA